MSSLVSIVVPCYNHAQYLNECLQSVIEQTYLNWECIIVNDGSPDDTDDIAQQWLEKDNRFKYIYKENGGLSSARNAGIAIAHGEFILPLDADDKIGLNYLSLTLEAFSKDASLIVVYSRAKKFGDTTDEWILKPFSLRELAKGNMIFCSAVYRKTDWEFIGGYDTNLIHGFEDWEFWIAMLKNGGNVLKIDYFGFYYRVKQKSMIKMLYDNNDKKDFSFKYITIKHSSFFINQLGTFNDFIEKEYFLKEEFKSKMKSKKFVLNAFTQMFFCFKIFKIK